MKARTKAILIAAKDADNEDCIDYQHRHYLCNSFLARDMIGAKDAKILITELYKMDSDIPTIAQFTKGFFGSHTNIGCREHRVMAACFAAAYSETEI